MQPRVLDDTEVNLSEEAVDMVLDLEEERIVAGLAGGQGPSQNLADGGKVGGVDIYPMLNGQRQARGRANCRRAWMWNGTESMLPLAWDTDGKVHDGARHYLRKRHCLCCHNGGFRGTFCPLCLKNGCTKCNGRVDPKVIIPNFYLRQEDVPFPVNFYGDIACFLQFCPRNGTYGFLTEDDMRIHARGLHTQQYQAHLETRQANKADEVDDLKRQMAELTIRLLGQEPVVPAVTTLEAPLYVSDKPKAKRKRET